MPQHNFRTDWNIHYDFNDPANQAEIIRVDGYDVMTDAVSYAVGDIITSPWGANRVISVARDGVQDVCIKEIIVNTGYMLSLQRHRARTEQWEVVEGTLGVILDSQFIELNEGDTLHLPKGALHTMQNMGPNAACVREIQTGINREADTIRLLDCHGRPTYPLSTDGEWRAAALYARLQDTVAARFGAVRKPHPALLSAA